MIFEKQIVNMYRGMAYTRCDDNGTSYYFSADDFAGLHKESYRFKSSKGYNLQGYLYYYDNLIKDRLVVFDREIGGTDAQMPEFTQSVEPPKAGK